MVNYTEIIERIKGKDPASMEMLYDTYGRQFYTYCIKKWECDEDNAWDIVYRTLETLVLKLDRYEFVSQAKFDGFLFRVLMNYIRKSFRSVRVQQGLMLEPVDFNEDQLPREVDEQLTRDAFERYYRDEEIENPAILEMNDALAQMDTEDRDILLLRAQNYSYEEVGSFLGIDAENLKVKYHRAKKKLIQLMTEKQKKGK
jgi:RNA polymerase sigma factor (sigma-70 family)